MSKHTPPRIAICRFPSVIEVRGAVRSFAMTEGAQVDLDAIVGFTGTGPNAVPLTLEAALGERIAHFEVVAPAVPAAEKPAAPVGAPRKG